MSDESGGDQPQKAPDPQEQAEQLGLFTLDDRVRREVAAIWGRYALVTDEGGVDQIKVANLIYPTVEKAVAEGPGDRPKVGITPSRLMETFFSDVPNPHQWAEYDEEDREVHEAVYQKVKAEVFRVLNVNPDGLIQSRLNANGGMVLCRTAKNKKGQEEMAYVTRNRVCINEDNNTPAVNRANRALDRAAALTAMAIERVPEHGKWFRTQYNTGTKTGIDGGKNKIAAALDSGDDDGE